MQAIENIKFQPGGTRLDLALELAARKLFGKHGSSRPDKPKFLVIVTDLDLPQELQPFKPIMDKLEVTYRFHFFFNKGSRSKGIEDALWDVIQFHILIF